MEVHIYYIFIVVAQCGSSYILYILLEHNVEVHIYYIYCCSTMWKFMSDNKDEVMVGSNKEGVEKVIYFIFCVQNFCIVNLGIKY